MKSLFQYTWLSQDVQFPNLFICCIFKLVFICVLIHFFLSLQFLNDCKRVWGQNNEVPQPRPVSPTRTEWSAVSDVVEHECYNKVSLPFKASLITEILSVIQRFQKVTSAGEDSTLTRDHMHHTRRLHNEGDEGPPQIVAAPTLAPHQVCIVGIQFPRRWRSSIKRWILSTKVLIRAWTRRQEHRHHHPYSQTTITFRRCQYLLSQAF